METFSKDTLEAMARAAGFPERLVGQVVGYYPSKDGQPARFEFRGDVGEERKVLDQMHLAWLLDFAQRPVDSLAESVENDQEPMSLGTFVAGSLDAAPNPPAGSVLADLSREVHDGLSRTVAQKPWSVMLAPKKLEQRVEWYADGPDVRLLADWRTTFLLRAAELFRAFGKHLKQCRGQLCGGKIFLSKKGQEYCSVRCSLAERQRRFKEHPDWPQRRRTYVQNTATNKAEKVRFKTHSRSEVNKDG